MRNEWTAEQDAFLKSKCETTQSYGDIEREFANVFGRENAKSRSAIMGRASRKGWAQTKPESGNRGYHTGRRKELQTARRNRIKRVKVTKSLLRAEGDRAIGPVAGTNGRPCVKSRALVVVPQQEPIATSEAGIHSCMWPMNDDVSAVCGASVVAGAYCALHALQAYRVMPTEKRQARRAKLDTEHTLRIDGSQHREKLDPDGEWLNRMILEGSSN